MGYAQELSAAWAASRTSPSRSRSSASCPAASTRSARHIAGPAAPPSASAGRSAARFAHLRARPGADLVGLSDRGRPLSLGLDPRQPVHRLAFGLAQPARPGHRARRHQRRHLLLLPRCLRRPVRPRGTPWPTASSSSRVITGLQALINHFGIGLTAKLTDFSGYLIFATAIAPDRRLSDFAPGFDRAGCGHSPTITGTEAGGGLAATRSRPHGVPAGAAAADLYDHRL